MQFDMFISLEIILNLSQFKMIYNLCLGCSFLLNSVHEA